MTTAADRAMDTVTASKLHARTRIPDVDMDCNVFPPTSPELELVSSKPTVRDRAIGIERAASARLASTEDIRRERETRMPQPSVYLAGPITGLSFKGCTDWRDYAKTQLGDSGIVAYSPLRCKEYLADRGVMDAMGYDDAPLSSPKGITTRDRWDVTTRDLTLVNFVGADRVSIGTVMEIAWADLLRKPVVVAMERDNVHVHAMLTHAAGFIVETLDEALALTAAVLLP